MDRQRYIKSFDVKRLSHQRRGELIIMRGLVEQIGTIIDILPQAGAPALLAQLNELSHTEPLERAYKDLYGNVGGDFAQHQFQRLTRKSHKAKSDWIEHMRNFAINDSGSRISDVSDVTLKRIRSVLQRGIDEGWGTEQMARAMKESNAVNRVRARVIARTEIISASNAGADIGARSTGLTLKKSWLASIDGRERESHKIADNVYQANPIPMDDYFVVGGETCRYPGDPRLTPENSIQCRCVHLMEPV